MPGDKRDWFEQLIKGVQGACFWQEDHTFYHDMFVTPLGRRAAIEFGRRLAKAGVIDDPEDINFLYPEEITATALAMEYRKMKDEVMERKKRQEESCTWDVPFIIGDPDPSALHDFFEHDSIPRLFVVFPQVKPELKADLYGAASTSGVVEGTARVVLDFDQL